MHDKNHRWILFYLFLMLASLLLNGCAAPPAPKAAPGLRLQDINDEVKVEVKTEKITYALYQEPLLLNPYMTTQEAAGEVYSLIVEGLLNIDPEGNFFPVLALEVPTIENGLVSRDGLSITYPLRDDVLWSDGAAFTCSDVRFTYQAIIHPASTVLSIDGYNKIRSVECIDDQTVVINFYEFYARYHQLFPVILPRHATGRPSEMADWAYNWLPVGTGPFVMTEWIPGATLALAANPLYREYPERPKVEEIDVEIVPSRDAGKRLLGIGEVDILWDLPETEIGPFINQEEIILHTTPNANTERLILNLANPREDITTDPTSYPHPFFADERVRRAIQFGIDKQRIVDELFFGLTNVGTSELSIGPSQCEIEPSRYDLSRANALLNRAGFTDEDGDGVRECNGCQFAELGTPLRIKYQTTAENPLREATQVLITEMMAEIGIELVIENIPSTDLFAGWNRGGLREHGRFDILMYATKPGVDPHEFLTRYFHQEYMPLFANEGVGSNYSRWINEEASIALEKVERLPNTKLRNTAYQIVCDELEEEIPHIYLYDHVDVHLSRRHILNFEPNPWRYQSWNGADWDTQAE